MLRGALRRIERDYPATQYVFVSERNAPLTPNAFRKILARAGEKAKLGFPTHPHMLRHACGYYLANQGIDTRATQVYLGHSNIQHSSRYTELAPNRFEGFWGGLGVKEFYNSPLKYLKKPEGIIKFFTI